MSSGILYGLSAYVLWGLFPLFFKQLQAATALEVVLHRMVWSLVFVLIVLAALRRFAWLADVRRNPALLGKFAVSAVLLGVGFPVNALKGVPMLARTASLIAHLNEELEDPIGFALSYQAARDQEYTGSMPKAG